ncbi:MAG: TraB/GumN family protein [Vallitalea sp.]|jgi:uncharacterized protein YbaP (TraB family)|nr:TraB/GumN family protein [Vallitalea sp.]
MKKSIKKIMILCMSLVLTLVSLNYNYQVTYANTVPAKQPELPSLWALEDIQMLNIYDIINPEMFYGYKSEVTKEQLYIVGIKLYEKITNEKVTEEDILTDSFALQKAAYKLFNAFLLDNEFDLTVTRKDVIDVLYRVIRLSQPTFKYDIDYTLAYDDISSISKAKLKSVNYLVSNQLINGSNNQLGLTKTCTKEQLFALTSRVYYYVVQKSDKAAKGAFWKVTNGKNTIYLLGSIHIANSSLYPMNDDILNAFNKSDALCVEVNTLGDQTGLAYMQQKMYYTDGTTIDKVISKETYEAYEKKMKSLEILPKEQYDLLKPWCAAFTIQNYEASKQTIVAGLGVDMFFMSKSIYRKPIVEIEGYKFQTDLLDSFSTEIQEDLLKGVLTQPVANKDTEETNAEVISDNIKIIELMLDYWKAGDVDSLEKLVAFDESAANEFTKKFWIERNNHMYESVLNYLNDESGNTYFVVVGAGHMVGNTGIVKQLIDKGYTVDQVK